MPRLLAAVLAALALLGPVGPGSTASAASGATPTQIDQAFVADLQPPVAGQVVTFTAVVRSGSAGVPNVSVTLLTRPAGATGYLPVATVVSDPDGNVSADVRLTRTTAITWRFDGDSSYASARTDPYAQPVATRVRASANDLTLRRGQRLVVAGTTFPAKPGSRVSLWRGQIPYPLTQGPAPSRVAVGVVRADGTLRLVARFRHRGVKQLFVKVAGGGGNVTGYSRYLRIRVR